jgi:hypothetical protein
MKNIDINTCTVQEACDYAMHKIVEQGGPCTDEMNALCVYGDNRGHHCAVGWLLNHDDENVMAFSGSVEELIDDMPEAVPEVIRNNSNAFQTLQQIHDFASPGTYSKTIIWERFDSNYEYLQRKYGINTGAPDWKKWREITTRVINKD